MDAGEAWERLLHTPTTWIVVAVVLFVVAVVLLVAGARAGRAARRERGPVAAAPGVEDDPGCCPNSGPRWFAHWPALARPPGRAGPLRSSGNRVKTANTAIAAAVRSAKRGTILNSNRSEWIHANSVRSSPSPASPTVT